MISAQTRPAFVARENRFTLCANEALRVRIMLWGTRPMSRVLIADDEDSMRQLVARAIAMDGHQTVTAQDGAEALEILTREDGAFDLLLTDIQMPVMDGIALALSAARDFPNLTILLMTGFADQRERASNLNALVHDVVTKPFSVADIRTAVADALAARKG
jgi:CheY-like chemotaxis protein